MLNPTKPSKGYQMNLEFLPKQQQLLIRFIANSQNPVTVEEIMSHLKVSRESARSAANRAVKNGILKKSPFIEKQTIKYWGKTRSIKKTSYTYNKEFEPNQS